MPKAKRSTRKQSKTQPKSIGPRFFAVLLVFVLALVSLVSSSLTLSVVRSEMKTAFDYETRTAIETLVGSIDTLYESDPTAKDLALEMVEKATWNDSRRHFWAADSSDSEVIAGTKDHEIFYSAYEEETSFGFIVVAGYDEAYFNESAYPTTKEFVGTSIAFTLVFAILALGVCIIAFHRSSNR